jgi:hypothetical protein
MSLETIWTQSGQGTRVTHLILDGARKHATLLACDRESNPDGNHFWLVTQDGHFLTVKPHEAASGWRVWVEPKKFKKVKLQAWVHKNATIQGMVPECLAFSVDAPMAISDFIRAEHLDFETEIEA